MTKLKSHHTDHDMSTEPILQAIEPSLKPYNAEPHLPALTANPYTPEDLVYCRNHGALGYLYRLEFRGSDMLLRLNIGL